MFYSHFAESVLPSVNACVTCVTFSIFVNDELWFGKNSFTEKYFLDEMDKMEKFVQYIYVLNTNVT